MSEKRFTIKPQDDYWAVVDNYNDDKVCIINGIHTEIEAIWLCDFMNDLKEEKDSLVRVIDENLLKGYHEQSLKHKEAKEKMEHKDEMMEASALIDAVFYWKGYVKALEELKERVSDE